MVQIKEIDVVDSYYDLKIGARYSRDKDKIAKRVFDVFANFGLKIIQFDSLAFKAIKMRYSRVEDQIKLNQKNAKHNRHDNFDSEKIFFCDSEYPELCDNQSTTTTR